MNFLVKRWFDRKTDGCYWRVFAANRQFDHDMPLSGIAREMLGSTAPCLPHLERTAKAGTYTHLRPPRPAS
ncbi:MAG: hypothetical protein GF344_09305 [Chitinivibrionales bacterium]|nr:hypothetical protein [Chitinivibrionales bacterium]MBD3357048.1 hypothetical protein [Chitinivibrionales bacterium]